MKKKLAFLFPGQGSQEIGMGFWAMEHSPIIHETYEEADQVLNFSLSNLMKQGPLEELTRTENAQPAILASSVALGRWMLAQGIEPSVLAGHSLGEYSALVLSGAVTFQDAIRLVHLRGKFMQEAVPLGEGTMMAVLGTEDEIVEEICHEVSASTHQVVEPANYNCPGQLVISGHVRAVEEAGKLLKDRGVKRVVPLTVSAPFHSSLLKPAAERLKPHLENIQWRKPKQTVIANVDGLPYGDESQIGIKLYEQIYRPVLWKQSLEKVFHDYATSSLEIGPGQVVSGHVKKVSPDVERYSTSNEVEYRKAIDNHLFV